jgi:hypothetical protein
MDGEKIYTLVTNCNAFEKPEKGRQMTLVIKDHKFEVVGNAGHCPWLDQPERCGHLAICMLED